MGNFSYVVKSPLISMKIHFFCIGVQKAGTTSLHDILSMHPQIYLPKEKEANFFDVDELYAKGINWYHSFFYRNKTEGQIVGNINPNLLLDKKSILRILKNYGSSTKFILILRDPVDRAYSHYLMSRKRGYETKDFLAAIKAEQRRISEPISHPNYYTKELGHFEKNHFGYIRRSLYSDAIKYLLHRVPKDNLKIILFEEDLIGNKENTIREILAFLEVENSLYGIDLNVKSNRASESKSLNVRNLVYQPHIIKTILKYFMPWRVRNKIKQKIDQLNSKPLNKKDSKLSPQIKKELYHRYFKEDVEHLEQMIDRSLKAWYTFKDK